MPLSTVPYVAPDPETWDLPRPIGWVDGATENSGRWMLGGWALPARGSPFDALTARWNGEERGAATTVHRPPVAEAVPWVRRAPDGGFQLPLERGDDGGRLDLIGEHRGRAVARLSTTFMAPSREVTPLPPDGLALRVSGMSGESFRLSGLKAFTDLWDQVAWRVADMANLRVLDWGCGCGRVTRYLTRTGAAQVNGCDIDEEAIDWCAAHLDGHFARTTPEPPLPFADDEIDVVLASSVFTHLARAEQRTWLGELRRILAPGGLLVASVSGDNAFLQSRPRLARLGPPGSLRNRVQALRWRRMLERAGIMDGQRDDWLDGIAPPDYYRLVYQTRSYTADVWGTYLELLDYIERGHHGHQDLVVMRAP